MWIYVYYYEFNLKIMYVQFITHWYKQNIEEKNAC